MNFNFPYNRFAFDGGYRSGFAYWGAIDILEKNRLIDHVEHVAGISDQGALTATLLALGYKISDFSSDWPTVVEEKLLKEKISSFGDLQSLAEKFLKIKQRFASSPQTLTSALKLFKELWLCNGSFKIGKMKRWIDDKIKEKTGFKSCTFFEFRSLMKKISSFKHLHLFGVDFDKIDLSQIIHFTSEDPIWDDLIISEVVSVAMVLPGFRPHQLHFKDHNTQERYIKEGFGSRYVSADLFSPSIATIFDAKGDTFAKVLEAKGYHFHHFPLSEEDYPCFNSGTLGFGLQFDKETFPVLNPLQNLLASS